MVPTAGGIKPREERKDYGEFLLFRKSSVGTGHSEQFGEAMYQTYEACEKYVTTGVANKSIKVSPKKSGFCSPVQKCLESGEILEDPMIRMKLPFGDDGRQLFKLYRVVEVNGKATPVPITCNKDNVHTIIRSRTLTSGYAVMDSLTRHAQGISFPCKIKLLIIKDPIDDVPTVEDLLGDDLAEMMGEAVDAPAPVAAAAAEEVVEDAADELAALQLMAANV
jgi:hypothetical protein